MNQSSTRSTILSKIQKAVDNLPKVENVVDFYSASFYPTIENALTHFITKATEVGVTIHTATTAPEIKEVLQFLHKKFPSEWMSAEPALERYLQMSGIHYKTEIKDNYKAEIVVTSCEFMVARTGSILLSSFQPSGRRMATFAPIHIVIAYEEQLVHTLTEAYQALQDRYHEFPSWITTVTGPSRSADIEKTLVKGAHGPKELHILLLKNA